MIKGQKVKENNMSNYVISCCSTADLTEEHFKARDISYICFHFELNGKEYAVHATAGFLQGNGGRCHDKDLADQSGGVHGVLQAVS